FNGCGVSALSALRAALLDSGCGEFDIVSCHKHSTNLEPEPQVIAAYVQIERRGNRRFGAGIDVNGNRASARALLSALNRLDEHRTFRPTEARSALESKYHCKIPDEMLSEFEGVMKSISGRSRTELESEVIWNGFLNEFVA